MKSIAGSVQDVRLVAGSEVAGVLGEAQHQLSLECTVDVGPMASAEGKLSAPIMLSIVC